MQVIKLILSVMVAFAVATSANASQTARVSDEARAPVNAGNPDAGGVGNKLGAKGGKKGAEDFMANLSAEQKTCLEKNSCPKPDFIKDEPPADGPMAKGEKPKEKPELTPAQRNEMEKYRECTDRAMETCKIDMPGKKKNQQLNKPIQKGKIG